MMKKVIKIRRKTGRKIIIKLPSSLAMFGDFKRTSRLRPILIFPTMCNTITRTSFVPRAHSLPLAHVHLSQSVCIFLFPLLGTFFPMTFGVSPSEAFLVLIISQL
jgi:hypothetical protein